MERRDFIKYSSTLALSLPISASFLSSAAASAQDDSGWISVPGTEGRLQIKDLFAAGTAKCRMYKLAPGFPVGPHRHPAGEYSYVVEGSFEFSDITYVKGDYVYKEPGSADEAAKAGPEGTIVLVFTPEPIQPLPPPSV
jgi:quercetin dioxygenase-like cupin family protein